MPPLAMGPEAEAGEADGEIIEARFVVYGQKRTHPRRRYQRGAEKLGCRSENTPRGVPVHWFHDIPRLFRARPQDGYCSYRRLLLRAVFGQMRSILSDDIQGIGWWLASDGKWYPPDLHPAARSAVSGEQARIAALFDAAIGVAQVGSKVFAQVQAQGTTGSSSSGENVSATSGAEHGSAGDPSSRQRTGVGHATDPLPRFRGADRPKWPFEARELVRAGHLDARNPVETRPATKTGHQAATVSISLGA